MEPAIASAPGIEVQCCSIYGDVVRYVGLRGQCAAIEIFGLYIGFRCDEIRHWQQLYRGSYSGHIILAIGYGQGRHAHHRAAAQDHIGSIGCQTHCELQLVDDGTDVVGQSWHQATHRGATEHHLLIGIQEAGVVCGDGVDAAQCAGAGKRCGATGIGSGLDIASESHFEAVGELHTVGAGVTGLP